MSDVTLKSKGVYDDSIRLNRRQKRKAKAGTFSLNYVKTDFIEQKRLAKREKLAKQEEQLRSTLTSKVQAMKESASILVEGLPAGYNHLMLQELVRGYKGLQDYKVSSDTHSATIQFTRHEDAKLALAGRHNPPS